MGRDARRSKRSLVAAAALAACDAAQPAGARDAAVAPDVAAAPCPTRAADACPEGWVRTEVGGCGPAVVVCAPGGGAAARACDGVDLTTPGPAGFYRDEGGVAGPWTAARATAGRDAPPVDFTPITGISTCPTGWARATDGACDPRLDAPCAAGEASLPARGCTRTGEAACGPDPWPALPPEAAGAQWVHVRAGAAPDGADGSAERPFPTLVAGLGHAVAGAWVRVAAGSYAESFTLTRSMHVVGACAARVAVALPEGATYTIAVAADGAGVSLDLRGLTVRGGVRADRGAALRLAGVRIEDAPNNALVAAGAGSSVTATDVVVTRRAGSAPAAPNASGVLALGGGRVELTRAAVSQGPAVMLRADGAGSSLRLTDGAVGPATAAEVADSAGVLAQRGGAAALTRVALANLRGRGVVAAGAGSSAAIEDVVVRDVTSRAESSGDGVAALAGGAVRATRLLVQRCTYAGARAEGEGSALTLREAVVRDGRFDARGDGGYGLVAEAGAALDARAVRVIENNMIGVFVRRGGVGAIEDVVVFGTRSAGAATSRGYGVDADEGGRLTVARARVEGNLNVGAGAIVAGSELELVDSVVVDTASSGGRTGFGVAADQGATVRVRRTRVESSTSVGVYSARGSAVELEGCAVRGTRPDGSAAISGDGLKAERAALRAAATLVEANVGAGAIVTNGGELTLTGCLVRATAPTDDVPPAARRGHGLVATTRGALRASATAVEDNTEVGALATDVGSTLALAGSAVLSTRPDAGGERGIGLSVQRGAAATLDGVLLQGNSHAGLIGFFRAEVTANDLLILDTRPERRGYGVGVSVFGATVAGARWAVAGAGGVGVSAAWSTGAPATLVRVDGLFVRDVSPQAVTDPIAPGESPVSYGLFVGEGSTLDAAAASVDRCDWGFFQSLGALALPGAAVTRSRVALGAVNGSSSAPTAGSLRACGNRRDEVQRDVALPEVRLPPPREL